MPDVPNGPDVGLRPLFSTTSASTEREAADASARDDLHAAIMNLPCKVNNERPVPSSNEQGWRDGYVMGHRDARHAAAELVLADRAASAPQAVRRPLTEEQIDALYEANCEPRNPYAPSRKFFGRTVRAAEFAHGIVPLAPQDTPKEGL